MALQKDIKVAGGFTASYHHITDLPWRRPGIVEIKLASFKDQESSKLPEAADRQTIIVESAEPITREEAYALVKQNEKFEGAADA